MPYRCTINGRKTQIANCLADRLWYVQLTKREQKYKSIYLFWIIKIWLSFQKSASIGQFFWRRRSNLPDCQIHAVDPLAVSLIIFLVSLRTTYGCEEFDPGPLPDQVRRRPCTQNYSYTQYTRYNRHGITI